MEKSIIQKMIEEKIISEKDIVEYYNANLKDKIECESEKVESTTYSIIEDGILINFDERDLNRNGGYTTPKGVHTIGKKAFMDCSKLRKIVLTRDVIEIEEDAFMGCTSLQSVKMTDSVRKIGTYAFYDCRSLTDLKLSNSIREISQYAFEDCVMLQEVILPKKLKTIEVFAFGNCRNLNSISTPSPNLEWVSEDAFLYAPIGRDFMRLYNKNKEEQKQEKGNTK